MMIPNPAPHPAMMFRPQPPPPPPSFESELPTLCLRTVVRVVGPHNELTALCEFVGNLAVAHAAWEYVGQFEKGGGIYFPATPAVDRQGLSFAAVFLNPQTAVTWLHARSKEFPGLRFEYHDAEAEFLRTYICTGQNGKFTQRIVGHNTSGYEREGKWELQRGMFFLIRQPLTNSGQL